MVPEGRKDELMVSGVGTTGGGATDMVTVAVADCTDELESTTETPNEKLPLAVGVPEMTPVFAARLSPAGSCPEAMLQV
jgi:hypothetical protein